LEFLNTLLANHPRLQELYALSERACGGRSWHNWLVIYYLQSRACDLVRYGQKTADLTFPQPTLKNTKPEEVTAIVAWMVQELYKYAQEVKEKEEQEWLVKRQHLIKQSTKWHLDYKEETRLAVGGRPYVQLREGSIDIPNHLPPRVLTTEEQAQIRTACLKDLLQGEEAVWAKTVMALIVDFSRFLRLLNQPENYIWIPSTQYESVNSRQYHDMNDEMTSELVKLPNYTAYLKMIGTKSGSQAVFTRKIETLALPPVRVERVIVANRAARQNAIDAGMLRERRIIREEIQARRERWEKRPVLAGPPPLEEPPRRQISPKKTASTRVARKPEPWKRCKPEVYDSRKVSWEEIKDDVLRIDRAQFGQHTFGETWFRDYFANPQNTIVLLWSTGNKKVVGFTIAMPAEEDYKKNHYERLAEIRALDAPTAYIANTVIDPAYTGHGLVGPLMAMLEKELVKKGYGYLDRDARTANNYARNIRKVYGERIITQHVHDSVFGPQMFFRIRLTNSSRKQRSKDIKR